jgi:hypothetical protein
MPCLWITHVDTCLQGFGRHLHMLASPRSLCLTLQPCLPPRLAPLPQAVIGNYAVPILEDKTVWGTTDETRISYLDTQDVARMALAALRCVCVCVCVLGGKLWRQAIMHDA